MFQNIFSNLKRWKNFEVEWHAENEVIQSFSVKLYGFGQYNNIRIDLI